MLTLIITLPSKKDLGCNLAFYISLSIFLRWHLLLKLFFPLRHNLRK